MFERFVRTIKVTIISTIVIIVVLGIGLYAGLILLKTNTIHSDSTVDDYKTVIESNDDSVTTNNIAEDMQEGNVNWAEDELYENRKDEYIYEKTPEDLIDSQDNTNESNSSEEDFVSLLSKYDIQGNVQVNATIENIQEDFDFITVIVQLNTHSVDLDSYDFDNNVSFYTSNDIEIKDEILWNVIEGGGHHITGSYKIPKIFDGVSIINSDTEYIELVLNNLDNIDFRKFRWNKEEVEKIM